MPWDDDLTQEQKNAAQHVGAPARLLAGPGTGKTRVLTQVNQSCPLRGNVPGDRPTVSPAIARVVSASPNPWSVSLIASTKLPR